MNIIHRTLDVDADTDARLREMADERGQDVAAVLAEAVAVLDSLIDIAGPDIGEDHRRLDAFKRSRAAGRREELGGKLGFSERTAAPGAAQDRMILLSPDAVEDVERLRAFLDRNNPGAARRALARHGPGTALQPARWVGPLRNRISQLTRRITLSAFARRATADRSLTHLRSYADSASDSASGWFDNRRSAGR
jgi:hypothetical protein